MNDTNDDKDLKTGKPPSPHVRVVEAPEVGLAEVVAALGELTRAVDRLSMMTYIVNNRGSVATPTGVKLKLQEYWKTLHDLQQADAVKGGEK